MARIVSVHSFRGGTGKSNTTANLAVNVARTGKRVAMIDTDIQSPGIHVLFGMDEESITRSLNEFLWGRCRIEEAAYDVSYALRADGEAEGTTNGGTLLLVPSSIKADEIAQVLRDGYDVSLLNDGFRDLIERLNLDYLFIDTHPGINEETLLSIVISDVLVLIMRPDRQDFQGTAVTVDVARKLDVPEILIVVNKALMSYDFDELKRQIEQIYDSPVAGILPLTEDVARLQSSDIFSLRYPDHLWSQTIRQISARVMD